MVALSLLAGCSSPPAIPDADLARVDNVLALMKTRLELAAAVAREQWVARGPVDDSDDELRLVRDAVNRTARYTLPPEVIHDFLQAQIDAAKQVQRSLHAQWRSAPPAAAATRPQDDARQTLAATTDPLLVALSQAYPVLRREGGRTVLEQRMKIVLHGVPGGAPAATKAVAPLWALAM